MRLLLLPQAQRDLAEIAEPLLSKVLKRLSALVTYPELGAPLEGEFAGFRSTVVRPFRIVYTLAAPQTLHVIYIRHCRRGRTQP